MHTAETPDDAEILSRETQPISPWVSLELVQVRMPACANAELYHGLHVADSVSVLAMTQDGRIPVVQQFRPIVGVSTWELPSGFRDPGESVETAAARELKEETGLDAIRVIRLGDSFELPARLTSRFSALFVLAGGELGAPEPGMRLKLVDGSEVRRMACAGELALPANVACLFLAAVNPDVRAVCAQNGFTAPPWL